MFSPGPVLALVENMPPHLLVTVPESGSILLEDMVAFVLCIGLAIFAYHRRILDKKGSVLAFFVGLIISLITDIYWLLTLVLFLVVTYGVTMMKYELKAKMGVAEPRRGKRSWRNVIANGAMPIAIVIISPFIDMGLAAFLYICAISMAAGDSFASEIGVFSLKDPCLPFPPFKRVPKGTDGGVSALGNLASILGAFIPALFGTILLSPLVPTLLGESEMIIGIHRYPLTPLGLMVPVLLGMLGSYIDSLLGATLQLRGMINNDEVNIISVTIGLLIAIPVYTWLFI